MTQISREDVEYLARLSGFELAESEIETLRADIDNIVEYIKQLGELDTAGEEPTYQVTGLQNIWREDKTTQENISREQLLGLSAEHADNSIKVPKVLQ